MKVTITLTLREDDEVRAAERGWEIAAMIQSQCDDVPVAGVERVDED